MKTITLKDSLAGQHVTKARAYNKDLFNSDRETIELVSNDYINLLLIDTNTTEAQTFEVRGSSLKETIIGIDNEMIAYLINANSTSYNDVKQVTINRQELTLQGFNFFMKDNDIEDVQQDYYNNQLLSKGYDITVKDISELGIFNTEYNCTTYSFEAQDKKHWLTINKLGQLSSIKSRDIQASKTVQPKETIQLQSVLA